MLYLFESALHAHLALPQCCFALGKQAVDSKVIAQHQQICIRTFAHTALDTGKKIFAAELAKR